MPKLIDVERWERVLDSLPADAFGDRGFSLEWRNDEHGARRYFVGLLGGFAADDEPRTDRPKTFPREWSDTVTGAVAAAREWLRSRVTTEHDAARTQLEAADAKLAALAALE